MLVFKIHHTQSLPHSSYVDPTNIPRATRSTFPRAHTHQTTTQHPSRHHSTRCVNQHTIIGHLSNTPHRYDPKHAVRVIFPRFPTLNDPKHPSTTSIRLPATPWDTPTRVRAVVGYKYARECRLGRVRCHTHAIHTCTPLQCVIQRRTHTNTHTNTHTHTHKDIHTHSHTERQSYTHTHSHTHTHTTHTHTHQYQGKRSRPRRTSMWSMSQSIELSNSTCYIIHKYVHTCERT
jgi:hypothetical protein